MTAHEIKELREENARLWEIADHAIRVAEAALCLAQAHEQRAEIARIEGMFSRLKDLARLKDLRQMVGMIQ